MDKKRIIIAFLIVLTNAIGATAILICFCVIAWRGLRISARAEDRFGALVALGLTTMIAVQAFVNMSVVLGLLPTKDIPLPLVSNGESSLNVSLRDTRVRRQACLGAHRYRPSKRVSPRRAVKRKPTMSPRSTIQRRS